MRAYLGMQTYLVCRRTWYAGGQEVPGSVVADRKSRVVELVAVLAAILHRRVVRHLAAKRAVHYVTVHDLTHLAVTYTTQEL